MMSKRVIMAVLLGLVLALILAACSSMPTPTATRMPTTTPTPTLTPTAAPNEASGQTGRTSETLSLPIFSPDSPFNQQIGPQPAIDPESDFMAATLVRDAHEGFNISVKQWSSPVYLVDADTPRHDVEITCGEMWGVGVTRLKNVPIPDWAEPAAAGGTINPDVTCGEGDPETEGDYHVVIIDPLARCEYDFWQFKKTPRGWSASWGNATSIDGDGIFPMGMSARGSGFAFTAGIIWPDEMLQGRIDHALAFNYSSVKVGGPVPPATDSDGESERLGAIPEGARVQLDPDLDLDTLDLADYEKTIARALQEYGMFLVDSGGEHGGMSLYAVDPKSWAANPYEGIWPDEDYVSIANIPADRFRVLELPPQVPDPELAPVPNACTVWE